MFTAATFGPTACKSAPDLTAKLTKSVVGQDDAISKIVPYIRMFQTGLSPQSRPAGVFLLLGPTGTGKTRTVEAIAEALHGDPKKMIKIDCAEFQLNHEVAKLIGSPPGYMGHRETVPILSQAKLDSMVTERFPLAVILFDEIEKASASFHQILLGILDKGTLHLGDNTEVNLENTIIFFTSNLGQAEMSRSVEKSFGFAGEVRSQAPSQERLEKIAITSVERKFSPEFVNRIDAIITYRSLDDQALGKIVEQHMGKLQAQIDTRFGTSGFTVCLSDAGRAFLLQKGSSAKYGARELARTVHRYVAQPLASLLVDGLVQPGTNVAIGVDRQLDQLSFDATPERGASPSMVALVVAGNGQLERSLRSVLESAGFYAITAGTAAEAKLIIRLNPPDLCIVDSSLLDGRGMDLAGAIHREHSDMKILVLTDTAPAGSPGRSGLHLIQKPFATRNLKEFIDGGVLKPAKVTRRAGKTAGGASRS